MERVAALGAAAARGALVFVAVALGFCLPWPLSGWFSMLTVNLVNIFKMWSGFLKK